MRLTRTPRLWLAGVATVPVGVGGGASEAVGGGVTSSGAASLAAIRLALVGGAVDEHVNDGDQRRHDAGADGRDDLLARVGKGTGNRTGLVATPRKPRVRNGVSTKRKVRSARASVTRRTRAGSAGARWSGRRRVVEGTSRMTGQCQR